MQKAKTIDFQLPDSSIVRDCTTVKQLRHYFFIMCTYIVAYIFIVSLGIDIV